MNLAERLRGVVRPGGSASPNPPGVRGAGSADLSADPATPGDVADTLGGEWREGRGQRYLIVDRHKLDTPSRKLLEHYL